MSEHIKVRKYTENDVEIEEEEIAEDFEFDAETNRIETHLKNITTTHHEKEEQNKDSPTQSDNQYSADFEMEEKPTPKPVMLTELNEEQNYPDKNYKPENEYANDFEVIPTTERKEPEQSEIKVEESTYIEPDQTMFAIYSKPNLKPKRKMPAICPSVIKSRPGLENTIRKKSSNCSFIYTGTNAKETLNATEVDPGLKARDKRDLTELKSRSGQPRGNDELIPKIEEALLEAERLLMECNSEQSLNLSPMQWRKVEKQNMNLRKQLKTLNELLSTLLLHKADEMYRQRRKESRLQQRAIISKYDSEINQKRLKTYEDEYMRLKSRLQQISDPQYVMLLKGRCAELSKLSKKMATNNTKLELQQKLESYKCYRAEPEEEKAKKVFNEINDMVNTISYTLDMVHKFDERLNKCTELIQKESEQMQKLKEAWRKIVKLANYYNITPTKRSKGAAIHIKEYEMIKRELEKLSKDRESLKKRQLINMTDFDKHTRQLENRIKLVNNEIQNRESFIVQQESMIQELIYGFEQVAPKNIVLDEWEEKMCKKDDELEILLVERREYFAAKKIQRHWKAHIKKVREKKAKREKGKLAQEVSQGGSVSPAPKKVFNFKKIEEEREKKEVGFSPEVQSTQQANNMDLLLIPDVDGTAKLQEKSENEKETVKVTPVQPHIIEQEDPLEALFNNKPGKNVMKPVAKDEREDFLYNLLKSEPAKEEDKKPNVTTKEEDPLDALFKNSPYKGNNKDKVNQIGLQVERKIIPQEPKKQQSRRFVPKKDVLDELDDL